MKKISTLVLILSFVTSQAVAANAPAYSDLLKQSTTNAPALLEQAANVRAASAEAKQAYAWKNPVINALSENIGAPQVGGSSQRQDTYLVTQHFEIGGKREARIEVGERTKAAVEARNGQTQITFAAQLAVAYATAEAMQIRQELASEELSRAKDDLRAARELVKAGKEAELRVVQAQSGVAQAQASHQASIADASQSLERLSALVGAPESFTRIAHPFLAKTMIYRQTSSESSAESPSVKSAIAEREMLNAQVTVEEKQWIPDIGLSAGVRNYGWTSGSGYVVGINATIPLFDNNQSGIQAARERAIAASVRLRAARLESAAERRSAEAQLIAADQRVEAAMQGESFATQAYRLGRIGYSAGKTGLLELLNIRRALTDAKLLTVDARLARIRALALLSIVDGRMVFGDLK